MLRNSPGIRLLRFGAYELDRQQGELRRSGVRLPLQGQPLQILELLLLSPKELVSREQFRQALWPNGTFVDFDDGLNSGMRRLRQVLGDDADQPRFIETLPRRGYRCLVDVESVQSGEQDPINLETKQPAAAAMRKRLTGTLLWLGVPILLLTLGTVALLMRNQSRVAAPIIQSLAVLPLENLSNNPDQEYFADGMTEAVITNLGKIGALRVISRRSVMHFKATKETVPEIARQLNVDAVVEGSVERSGDRIRVSVNLIQASPEKHLWAEKYDREAKEILLLESELAQAIAGEIRVRLTPQEHLRLAHAQPVNPEAYEAYVKGRYFLNKRSEKGFEKAIEYLKDAINQDPNYAEPYAALSQSYGLASYYGAIPMNEASRQAKVSALKALALDETLSEAHAAYALALDRDWQWQESDKEFRRSIELNPSYMDARNFYVNYLRWMGRVDKALALAQETEKLDPISPMMATTVGSSLLYVRRYDEAIAHSQRAIELEPTFAIAHRDLGRAYDLKGMFPQAIAEFNRAIELFGRTPIYLGPLGHAYAASGRRTEALKVIDELQQPSMRELQPEVYIALVYTGLGEKDDAFRSLEALYQKHHGVAIYELQSPFFDPLRSDPRFADLLRRMGLPE